MDTIELTFTVPDWEHDRIIGWLEDRATGFVQKDAELRAYVPAPRWIAADQDRLEERLAADGYSDVLDVRVLGQRNWNATWEDAISPVRAGPFLVSPPSVTVPADHEDATVLRIDPAQSFGTGHHASTRLALQLLAEIEIEGERMLDVGVGTGVLAIAACRLGAASVLGVDTDSNAVSNARANVAENQVAHCVTVREGSTGVVRETHFDVVAANITRRILLELLPDLVSRLGRNGQLLLSGVLTSKHEQVVEAAFERGLHLRRDATEDGWWAALFSSTP